MKKRLFAVALHPEGVDRNLSIRCHCLIHAVALHPEGVDRNKISSLTVWEAILSPSTRRAWIEIAIVPFVLSMRFVALHPEGVDRNPLRSPRPPHRHTVALHPEGVDRNASRLNQVCQNVKVALHPEGVDRNFVLMS